MLKFVPIAVVGVLFIYQVNLNLNTYLEQPTAFTVSLESNLEYRLPLVSFCPSPAFDPIKLKNFGLNISGDYVQFEKNYKNLYGVADEVEAVQLWQEANWNLNQMISGIFFKDSRLVTYYNHSGPLPSMWRRSFSPLGPCLTFNAPPGKREVMIYLQNVPRVEPCKLVNELGELHRYQGLPEQCAKVEIKCNSSCGLEDYIYFQFLSIKTVFVYLHETYVSPEELAGEVNIPSYSERLFSGNYVLRKLIDTSSLKINPQLTDSSVIKGDCSHDPAYSRGKCYHRFHTTAAMDQIGCIPLSPRSLQTSVNQVCHTTHHFDQLFRLGYENQFPCQHACKQRKWSFDIKDSFDSDFMVSLIAETTDIRKETEMETYPLAQLVSDTGGSLSLFLGVSILTFWQFLVSHASRYSEMKNHTADDGSKHCLRNLLTLTGTLLLSIAACTHSLEAVRSYIFQPKHTSVSLRTTTAQHPSDATLVARRLAVRALDCKPQESDEEECRVTCLLKEAGRKVASVAPFIDLEGLPPCGEAGLSLPAILYVVPQEILLAATTTERLVACHRLCGSTFSNQTNQKGFNMVVEGNYSSTDIITLACIIGGIIGLYLGYSIFDLIHYLQKVAKKSGLSSCKYPKMYVVIKVVVMVTGTLIALRQFHTFLMYHEVSASISKSPRDNHSDSLVITACRWPPLSLRHVADQLGINISDRLLYKLPAEERPLEVLRILNTLPGNWSNSSLDSIWEYASWNVTDVIEAFSAVTKDNKYITVFCSSTTYCAEVWQPVITPFSRCFQLNNSIQGLDVYEITLLFPEVLEKKSILGSNPQLYFTVSRANEPLLLSNLVPKIAYHRVLATYTSAQYERLGNDNTEKRVSHSTCVHRCMSEAGTAPFLCRLPYMDWRPDLPPCNQTQYASVPRYLKGLETLSGSGAAFKARRYVSSELQNISSHCYRTCRHYQRNFHIISIEEVLDYFPTVVVRLHQDENVLLKEEARQTAPQIISDVGGIAGSTVGFSILFLMQVMLRRFAARQG